MRDTDPTDEGGLPDPGGFNIDYTEAPTFEPTPDQVEMIRSDLKRVAEGVRPHLTEGFTVSTRLSRSRSGPRGHVVVAFPTGDVIGPAVDLTADMFESADDPDWDGPIPSDEIESMSRQIATTTIGQWAAMTGLDGGERAFPAR